jgi:carbon-monoxide dehydrogenase small subunit
MKIALEVNGTRQTSDVEPRLLLVHYLREVLGLTGTHVGCESSMCGSCTMFAVQADGTKVTTIEGLASNGTLHRVQQAFWEEHALQCGFCTPGMVMAACDLLARTPRPTDDQIRHGLEGNLCRCTGYQHIINAVQSAARRA